MRCVFTVLTAIALAASLGATPPAGGKARPPGRARVLAVGTYEGDYVGASKTFGVQQFRLLDVNLLLCMPTGKKGAGPMVATAVEGSLVIADKEMFQVEIVIGLPTFLMLKGDE